MDWIIGPVGILAGWLGASLLEYFKAKGKNLADKEDIQLLTRLVEDVKQENALLLEQVRGWQQLRMAAAERRLQAHQEAFTMWRELVRAVHHENVGEVVSRCQEWWEKNCLYLSADARTAFRSAYHAAHSHQSYLQGPRGSVTSRVISDNWDTITAAADALFRGAELPSLSQEEARDLTRPEPG